MPNSSKNSPYGHIKLPPSFGLIKNSPDTFLSRLPPPVTYPAITVHERRRNFICLLSYLRKLWMKHQPMDHDPSVCTCSGNRCSILTSSTLFLTSNALTDFTQCFLRQMGLSWNDIEKSLLPPGSPNSSGAGVRKRNSARKRKRD